MLGKPSHARVSINHISIPTRTEVLFRWVDALFWTPNVTLNNTILQIVIFTKFCFYGDAYSVRPTCYTYHRRHLRQIIGVRWPNRISNVALYHRCQSRPISESIITARWRLFGHVLRLPREAPAQRAIDHYFADTEAATFRGRPRTSLPSTLCSDLRRIGRTLRQPADIEALRLAENNGDRWSGIPLPETSFPIHWHTF